MKLTPDKFSTTAHQALKRAHDLALQSKRLYITAEFLARTMIAERGSVAAQVMRELGKRNATRLALRVRQLTGVVEESVLPQGFNHPVLSAPLSQILKHARRLGGRRRTTTAHLLLAMLLHGKERMSGVLSNCGLSVDLLREFAAEPES